jgi:hypothetical protein
MILARQQVQMVSTRFSCSLEHTSRLTSRSPGHLARQHTCSNRLQCPSTTAMERPIDELRQALAWRLLPRTTTSLTLRLRMPVMKWTLTRRNMHLRQSLGLVYRRTEDVCDARLITVQSGGPASDAAIIELPLRPTGSVAHPSRPVKHSRTPTETLGRRRMSVTNAI